MDHADCGSPLAPSVTSRGGTGLFETLGGNAWLKNEAEPNQQKTLYGSGKRHLSLDWQAVLNTLYETTQMKWHVDFVRDFFI